MEYNLYFHEHAKIKRILTNIIDNNIGKNSGVYYLTFRKMI